MHTCMCSPAGIRSTAIYGSADVNEASAVEALNAATKVTLSIYNTGVRLF